jgi:hypothetical protein
MPKPPDDAVLSPDGQYWWDGTRWAPVADAPPSNALLSPDGTEWWDGTSWHIVPSAFQLTPPQDDLEPAEAAFMLRRLRKSPGGLIAIGGALALTLGAFLPWLSFSGVFVGTVDASGFIIGESWFFIGFALVAVILGVSAISGETHLGVSVGLLVVGGLSALGVVDEFVNMGGRIQTADQQAQGLGVASYGAGLYVLALASAAVIVGGAREFFRWRHGSED